MARQTSIEAYNTILENGLITKMEIKVYGWLFEHGPATNRQIHAGSHVGRDLGVVSSRMSALVRKGVVIEVGTTICTETVRKVLVFDVTDKLPIKIEEPKRIECPNCEGNGWINAPKENKE